MRQAQKTVLVVAWYNKPEALRMASGLTLLDDEVRIVALGGLDDDDADTSLQLEALEFAEVPVEDLDPETDAGIDQLADAIIRADAVYVI